MAAPLDQERLAEQFITVVEQATSSLLQARASEGAKLAQLVVQRLQAMSQIVAQIPVGRLGTPAEIARTVSFLASENAGFITGSTLSINGGQYAA